MTPGNQKNEKGRGERGLSLTRMEEEEMEEDDEVEMEGFKSSEGRTYLIGEYPLLLLVLVVLHHPGFKKTAVCKESR